MSVGAASGCNASGKGHTLAVLLRTDLVPGEEFSHVELTLLPVDNRGSSARRFVDVGTVSFETASRLDEVGGLDADSYRLGVSLVTGDGVTITERPVLVDVQGNRAVTVPVPVPRSCLNVRCPEDKACFGGQCVDPRCAVETPEFCGEAGLCGSDNDCAAPASCSEAQCEFGICWRDALPEGAPNACTETQWCNPELGCQPRSGAEAGPEDGPRAYVALSERVSPLVRYWIDAGDDPTPARLEDSEPEPLDLTMTYGGATGELSPSFQQEPQGHLRFEGPPEAFTGGGRAIGEGNKLDALQGSTQASIELKYRTYGCGTSDSGEYRVFGLSSGTSLEGDMMFLHRYVQGREFLRIEFEEAADSGQMRMYCPPNTCPAEATVTVLHWVIDTEAEAEEDRVRYYEDGRRVFSPLTVCSGIDLGRNRPYGLYPGLGYRIDIQRGDPLQLLLGAPEVESNGRAANMDLYYAALYAEALTDDEVAAHAAALLTSDDRPVAQP